MLSTSVERAPGNHVMSPVGAARSSKRNNQTAKSSGGGSTAVVAAAAQWQWKQQRQRSGSGGSSVGTLQDWYVHNVPLPRVPQEQRASPRLTAPKARIRLPCYSLLPAWIPTLPKLGNVLGFSQRLL